VAVLGLLEERPRHPYDIAYTMQLRRLDEHIKLSPGTLYHVVEQLRRVGWIRSTETAREGRRPERTIYEVTPEGRRALQQRLRELISEPVREYSSFEAGLSFMHQLPREEAVALLRRRAAALAEQADLRDYALEQTRQLGVRRLGLIECEMVQDALRFQAEWSLRIADEIERGQLEWEPCSEELRRREGRTHTARPRRSIDQEVPS
jgi:DNA-binding PadR family transcriptional regulator